MSTSEDVSKYNSFGLLFPQIFNPLKYAKILIQLGYEPVPPFIGHNLLSIFNISNKTWRYPWIGTYVYYIYDKRGITHILTSGLFARLSLNSLSSVSQSIITQRICELNDEEEIEDVMEKSTWKSFFLILLEISVFRLYELIITHPFKVIMTRQMADFIVDSNENAWFNQAVLTIFKENRLKGFYKGIIPCLIGELCRCGIYYASCKIMYNMLESPKETHDIILGEDINKKNQTVKLLCRSILRFGLSNVFYPFEVVSTVMMLDNIYLNGHSQLSNFGTWRQCWRSLKLDNQLYRGYSFMFRNHVKLSK